MNIHVRQPLRSGIAVLLMIAVCSCSLAQSDLMSILENHQPEKQGAQVGGGAGGDASRNPAVATTVSGSVFANFLDRVNRLFAKLNVLASRVNRLIERLATAKTPKSTSGGSPGGSKPKASAPGNGESSSLNAWKGGKLSPAKFCELLGPVAAATFAATGVPASVTLAQAALETGWGASTIGSAKNLFGIKGTGPAGSVTVPTREWSGGRFITINAKFRKYNTWKESVDDHARLISQVSRYKNCMKYRNDPDRFAREVQKAGYATDPNYANKLIGIMKANNLYKWDK
ncbi:MAG TPA: glucosaminidase domain-containing protein [Candidatus Ozemobacteraceae bacterium]|nr:glucosaminidase domain-containing protein [Candidatus Ozemobacteraceae bacterium]HQG29147.1 glucosaminidase domain-containing protein [Candidatus Ozemobacteraceae bacterium]